MSEKLFFIAKAGDETFDVAPALNNNLINTNAHVVLCTKGDGLFLQCAQSIGFPPENIHIPTNRPNVGCLDKALALNMVSYFANMYPNATLMAPNAGKHDKPSSDTQALSAGCKRFVQLNPNRKLKFYKSNEFARKLLFENELKPIKEHYEQRLNDINKRLENANEEILATRHEYESSTSYRIGRAVTKLPRMVAGRE